MQIRILCVHQNRVQNGQNGVNGQNSRIEDPLCKHEYLDKVLKVP